MVEGNHMVYRISAPTPEEKDEWIHSIKYVNGKMEDNATEKTRLMVDQ